MGKPTSNKKIVSTERIQKLQNALLEASTKEEVLEIAEKIGRGEF